MVAQGKAPLDPYTFDYLLLCNKICGASHYNMQMKIVVDSPEDFKNGLKDKPTIAEAAKKASDEKVAEETVPVKDSTSVKNDTTVVAKVEM